MSTRLRWVAVAAVVGVILLVVLLKANPRAPGRPAEPASAPSVPAESSSPPPAEQSTPAASEDLPRLVDLGSTTCVPCKMMAPILEELTREYAGILRVEVLDVRRDPTLAKLYGIRVIPTQIFYDAAGQERFRHEGFMSKADILMKWQELGIGLTSHRSAGSAAG